MTRQGHMTPLPFHVIKSYPPLLFGISVGVDGSAHGLPSAREALCLMALSNGTSWWHSHLLELSIGLLVMAGVAQIILWQIKKLKQRNVELEVLLKLADSLTLELEAANRTLQEQSLTDPLTGLKNRRYIYATIAKDVAQVKRMYRAQETPPGTAPIQNNDLLFFMVDVDHFKWVNDHFGHGAGDAVLQQVADLLRSATRGSDTVVRWGGEEFLVVARQANRDDAVVVAERIRRFVERHRFELPDEQSIQRTCSVGFTAYPVDGVESLHIEWERVVDLADRCLYRAKEGGRNQWVGLMPQAPGGSPSHFTSEMLGDMDELLEQGVCQIVSSGPGSPATETISPLEAVPK